MPVDFGSHPSVIDNGTILALITATAIDPSTDDFKVKFDDGITGVAASTFEGYD